MPSNTDSILGCAAVLRETEAQSSITFDKWVASSKRFMALMEIPVTHHPVNMEKARLDTISHYESYLDILMKRKVQTLKLEKLKEDNRKKIQNTKRKKNDKQ